MAITRQVANSNNQVRDLFMTLSTSLLTGEKVLIRI
jgi:hypothetical protein